VSEFIDAPALAAVAVIAFCGGVGVVGLFSLGLISAARHPARSGGSGVVASQVLAAACMLACAGVIGVGIWALLDK
jgi:NADH:ubiquinone oxidoreductase subunit 6 (subunit J)